MCPFDSYAHQAELGVLRALLAGALASPPAPDLQLAIGALSSYRWGDEEHRVVYESLTLAMPLVLRNAAMPLPQQMAAAATRMGHPDVDWPLYFQPSPDSDLPALLRALVPGS